MEKIKAAFFDLDWTLYDHKNDRWDMPSIDRIKKLQTSGVKVFICTARPYHSFKWLGALDLGIEWDGYIASAGGYAFADGKYLLETKLDKADILKFIDLALKRNLTLELVELKDRKLIAPLTKEGKEYYSLFKEKIPEIGKYEGEDVVSFNFFAPESEDALFMKEFPHLIFYRFSPFSVDVMPVPHEKGACVKLFLDYFDIKKEESISFGDDLQDLTMAKETGFFICMGNGKDEVKNVSQMVADNVWDSGVKIALDQLFGD